MHGPRVIVDVYEWRSQVPGELERLGVRVEQARLHVGDYSLDDNVLIERKSVLDLHTSVAAGRYWSQIGRLRRQARWPVLLIEGLHLASGPIAAEAIRGLCLATSEQGIVILRSENPADSALWLRRLAARSQSVRRRDRPRYAQIPARPAEEAAEAMLAAVPGIAADTARALLLRFGTVAAVAEADRAAWMSVPGMGERRCDSLWRALHRKPLP